MPQISTPVSNGSGSTHSFSISMAISSTPIAIFLIITDSTQNLEVNIFVYQATQFISVVVYTNFTIDFNSKVFFSPIFHTFLNNIRKKWWGGCGTGKK